MKRFLAFALPLLASTLQAQTPVGVQGRVGAPPESKTVPRLQITSPGVYENLIVDGGGASGNLVKITADNVTVRNCEIRHGSGNGIGVFGKNVVIENCRIHHMLGGTFQEQTDAHGISGRWGDTIIRNCEISHNSGDCIQFDPDRQSSGTATIENCTLWTGPLPADAAGFKAGQRPGENAIDTKVPHPGPRCRLIIRNCYVHGWKQPAQIDNAAALNLKENVDAEVSNCVFNENEIALRVRGPGGRGGAHVVIKDCAIYGAGTGIRAEDQVEVLKIERLGFGPGVGERIRFVNGRSATGFENVGEHEAPPFDAVMKAGRKKEP